MATEYYYVHSATATDKSNSVHGDDSPFVKNGSNVTHLLTYTNGYIPANGQLEYHVEKQNDFNGKDTTSANKVPDPFAREDISVRGRGVIKDFWYGLDKPIVSRVAVYAKLSTCFEMLKIGDAGAAIKQAGDEPTDANFTTTDQAILTGKIQSILDDYPHL